MQQTKPSFAIAVPPCARQWMVVAACTILLQLCGCSKFFNKASESSTFQTRFSLPAPQLAPNTVALEVAVVTLDGERLEQFQQVWRKSDQQVLPFDVRKRLDANGFRVALLGETLPAELREVLAWSRPMLTADGEPLTSSHSPLKDSSSTTAFRVQRLEQLKVGEETWIPSASVANELAWTIRLDRETARNGARQRSGKCQLAQCGFLISQKPLGDNNLLLRLRPEVKHGNPKMRYGVDFDRLLVQKQRDKLVLPELEIAHPLRLGQTMLVSSTGPETDGFGHQFFAGEGFSAARQILLIRPVLMNNDDLFAPHRTTRALSTNLE